MGDFAVIAREDPRQADVAAMVAALDARMLELYTPESCHFMPVDRMADADVDVYVARLDGRAAGCAALAPLADGTGEVKRVWVEPRARGQGLGARLLAMVEERGRARGFSALRAETGTLQPDARAMFARAGFHERGPYGGYCADPTLVFIEKPLSADAGDAT